ncbi:MAG: GNAT family N-acetyltransferase [Pyrinomonadaceae bacterium]
MKGFGHSLKNVNLRQVRSADEPFLFRLYASTRAEEFAAVPWSEEQLQAFLITQFTSQQRVYDAQYPQAEHHIILYDDVAAGTIRANQTKDEIHLIDLALLPEYRNIGIGSSVLKEYLAEGRRSGRVVSLNVLKTNRAIRLYERLGFSFAGEDGAYLLMLSRPRASEET